MTDASSPALETQNLCKKYDGQNVVDEVSFSIEPGSFVGLLGPNGAGKTTVISILSGLIKQSSGSAAVMGCDVTREPLKARRNIGIVPQELVYDPFFSVYEYLRQQSSYYGIYDNRDWIEQLLSGLGLTDKAKANTRALSGGMKRRLMAAMALVHRPAVVVLDEPTAGVDISLRHSLWEFIRTLNRDGTTVLLTTHYLDEAEELCDRIILLDHGRVIADRSTVELVRSGVHGALALHLRLVGDVALPPEIVADCRECHISPDDANSHVLQLDSYAQIEQILASLRKLNLKIAEMRIAPPDLEDVFLSLTDKNNA